MTNEQLLQRIEMLERLVLILVKPDRYVFERPIAPGANGLRLGQFSTDKIALYNATPVAQQSAISAPSGGVTVDSQARAAIATLITTLQTLGLTA